MKKKRFYMDMMNTYVRGGPKLYKTRHETLFDKSTVWPLVFLIEENLSTVCNISFYQLHV